MRRFLLPLSLLLLFSCSARSTTGSVTVSMSGGTASRAPLPDPKEGEVVIRYNGISLNQLMDTKVGKQFLRYADESYKKEEWTDKALDPGVYALSNKETPPAAILASTLLAYHLQNENMDTAAPDNALTRMTGKSHCNENTTSQYVGFYWRDNFLHIDKNYCAAPEMAMWEAKL